MALEKGLTVEDFHPFSLLLECPASVLAQEEQRIQEMIDEEHKEKERAERKLSELQILTRENLEKLASLKNEYEQGGIYASEWNDPDLR